MTNPEAILRPGTRVWHRKYGNGEVSYPDPHNPYKTVVKFQNYERKLRISTRALTIRD